MPTEALIKFAEELKGIRESKKITLQQIANKTKIDIKFLQAIEEANFNVLPEIYIKAFIKEYAQTIDLNPDEVIRKYNLSHSDKIENSSYPQTSEETSIKGEPKTKEFNSIESEPTGSISETEMVKKESYQLNYIVGGLIIVVAVLLIYFAFIYESDSKIITDEKEQTEQADKPRFEITKQDSFHAVIPESPKPISDSLRLAFTTSANVWVKVLADGKNVHQKVVDSRAKMEFNAKEKFSISVGNAGVIKIFFNDKEVENVGKYGEIRNIILTKSSIRYLTIPRDEKKSTTVN